VFEQGVGPAIEQRHGDDVVTFLGNIQNGIIDRRAAGAEAKPRDATFEFCAALFKYRRGRIHDARVDIARNCEVKEICTMLGIVKFVSDSLVDRNGDRLGGAVGLESGVYGQGLIFHGVSFISD